MFFDKHNISIKDGRAVFIKCQSGGGPYLPQKQSEKSPLSQDPKKSDLLRAERCRIEQVENQLLKVGVVPQRRATGL